MRSTSHNEITPKPPAVIIAGGEGRRMGGQDKCLLDLKGKPVLAHLIDRLGPQVSNLTLNANGDTSRFDGFDLDKFPDTIQGQKGPLAGILSAFNYADGCGLGGDWLLAVSSDTPFLPLDLVSRLETARESANDALLIAPVTKGQVHYMCALWRRDQAAALQNAFEKGTRSIRGWLSPEQILEVPFEADPYDPFFNINTPQDLIQAEKILSQWT